MRREIIINKGDRALRRYNLASKIQTMYVMDYVKNHYCKILDLCAGDGDISVILSKYGNTVYAVDNDEERLFRIKNKIAINNIKNIHVVNNSADDLHFPNAYFDLIICNSALEHIPTYKKVLKEIDRVLVPNGRLIITVPNNRLQFGGRNTVFWNCIINLPNPIKKIICKSDDLCEYNNLTEIRKYYNGYFKHVVGFSKESITSELDRSFKIIDTRYFMNYMGAFGHDCAYYFRWGKNRLLLRMCLLVCYIEHLIVHNATGKGILVVCQSLKQQ